MMIVTRIPPKAVKNKYSAIDSYKTSFFGFLVLIEIKEKIQEKLSITPTKEVSLSRRWVSPKLLICNDVITKRQNPRRFAEVPKIWGEVLFAISINFD